LRVQHAACAQQDAELDEEAKGAPTATHARLTWNSGRVRKLLPTAGPEKRPLAEALREGVEVKRPCAEPVIRKAQARTGEGRGD
jgi:hypothetical protein